MADADDKAAELRTATREANEVLKDLRRSVTEAKQLVKTIEAAAEIAVESRMAPVVKAGLDEFGVALKKAIDDGTAAVSDRFDTIFEHLMGEDRTSKRQGKPSIPELVRRAAAGDDR